MPPASAGQGICPNPDRGLGLNLLLGTNYERKKNKLNQDLQLDYKHYVATKKDLKTTEPHPQPQGLSLPIDDKRSVQDKLREERNKEYNLFLQEQAQIRKFKRGTLPITLKIQSSDTVFNTYPNAHSPLREPPASRRDAATLTEAADDGKRTSTWGPGHRGRRRWQLYRRREPYSSEEELSTDREEEFELRHRRKQDRHTPEPEYKEGRKSRQHRANRTPQDMMEVEAPDVHDQNNNVENNKSDLKMPDSMKMAARSRPATSKDKTEFATGLIIGAKEESTASQMRKEQYKQELLKQIAEQQRNKIREKKFELRVAATGATDPEKEPDRIKQFGAVKQQFDSWRRDVPYKPGIDLEAVEENPNPRPKHDRPTEDTEQTGPLAKSLIDYSTVPSQLTEKTGPGSRMRAAEGVPSLGYFNEDYHKDFSNMLGEVALPRVAGVPPPVPPTLTSNYKTPYDAAYYYYGTRNPLEPNLHCNHNGLPEGVQQSGNFHSPLGPSGRTEANDQRKSSPLDAGELFVDKDKQRRQRALNYQEALIQQIKEKEERKRREKEEKERYDAKIEAEMKAFNPWGRSGGGAPIKDQNGNLVSDLNHMHRINEESYRGPVSRNSGQTQSFLTGDGLSPGDETRAPTSHRLSGFNSQPTTEQLRMQDRYKEDLRQQIEENKRKQEEERERMRIMEEKDEKRVANERAHIKRQFEEEQRKQRKVQEEEEKKVWQEQKIEKTVPQSVRDRQEKREQLPRVPSPPIPTLQRKQTHLVASRPPSVVSQFSSRTERSVSAPQYRPVPVKLPQLQDGQQEVIRELSALRRYLRKEQRQLEVQLGQTDPQESHFSLPNRPRRRPKVDAFELASKQAAQPSTQIPSSLAAHVNMQNIREFNQLKCRDTESREEVRYMYPDPPADAQGLDIQQQALLREQQRKITLMKREKEHDFLDQQLSHHHSRSKPGQHIHRDSILPSESNFIDVYSGDACEECVTEQRPPQASAEHRERTARRRRRDHAVRC
uniref:centrosome and spindle pole-associated protein 1 isoform X2 n=1 Tax=Scatophagus argus TaxID=75038 RepID=UPI001ED863D2|nr:centrosome and spindle pole-associated protein 1 isoform X2 [Scatophagus argus]